MTLTPLNARAGPQVSGSKITQSTQNASKTGLREPFGPTQTSKNEKVSIVHVRSGHHTPQTPRRSSSSHDRPQTQHTLRVRLTAQENCLPDARAQRRRRTTRRPRAITAYFSRFPELHTPCTGQCTPGETGSGVWTCTWTMETRPLYLAASRLRVRVSGIRRSLFSQSLGSTMYISGTFRKGRRRSTCLDTKQACGPHPTESPRITCCTRPHLSTIVSFSPPV